MTDFPSPHESSPGAPDPGAPSPNSPTPQHDPTPSAGPAIGRRGLLAAGGLGALGVTFATSLPTAAAAPQRPSRVTGGTELRFSKDGRFKIIQFNDTQDDEATDRRTVETMARTLDAEAPDLVVINGDVITGGCDSPKQVKQAINNVVMPMESRRIPWAVTYGNHDEDSFSTSGVDEARMLRFYRDYDYNLNAGDIKGLTGTSNTRLAIADARSDEPRFGLWLLDSGRYAPDELAGQDFAGYPDWDWLRMDQVNWYRTESRQLEKDLGRKVPSLMFLHIALWEHRFMWWGSVDGRTEADAERGRKRHGIVGERNEDECPGPFNSGMFNALLERGDVRGVFVGHDHVNTYVGNYYGIDLGYSPGTGFGAYGLPGADRNRLRGGRVFELTRGRGNEVEIDTRIVFASDFDIDLTANDQPMVPLLLREELGQRRSSVRVRPERDRVSEDETVPVVVEVDPAKNDSLGWVTLFAVDEELGRERSFGQSMLSGGQARFEFTVPAARRRLELRAEFSGDRVLRPGEGRAELRVNGGS